MPTQVSTFVWGWGRAQASGGGHIAGSLRHCHWLGVEEGLLALTPSSGSHPAPLALPGPAGAGARIRTTGLSREMSGWG